MTVVSFLRVVSTAQHDFPLTYSVCFALPCMGGCGFGAGRSEPGGQSPLPNFIAPAVRRSWKSFWRITEGEKVSLGKRTLLGAFLNIFFFF